MGENGGLCRAPRGSIFGARGAPFDIIAALRRGNFDILPLRAIRDALALLARERGKEKRLSLFSSRSDISSSRSEHIESAEEGSPLRRLYRIARFGAQYLERAARNASVRRPHICAVGANISYRAARRRAVYHARRRRVYHIAARRYIIRAQPAAPRRFIPFRVSFGGTVPYRISGCGRPLRACPRRRGCLRRRRPRDRDR